MPADTNTAPLNTPVGTTFREYLVAKSANIKPDPGQVWKLELRGDGNKLYAHFDPQILVKYEWSGVELTGRIPAGGKGASPLRGVGEFFSRQPAAFLYGVYLLEVGQTEARLYDGDEQIWFGKGTQEGLKGKTYIEFEELEAV